MKRTRLIREYLKNLKTDKKPLVQPNYIVERLLKNTRLNDKGCWIRGKDSSVYTYVTFPNSQRLAHKVSYEVFNGKQLDHYGCHHCDVKACINPDHIFDGTQSDNVKDAIRKGRIFRLQLKARV